MPTEPAEPNAAASRGHCRCPACRYTLDGTPGVPEQPFSAFELDVQCPECGLAMTKGTLALTGGVELLSMHRGFSWARTRGMLARYGVTSIIFVFLLWRGWAGLTGVTGTVSPILAVLLALSGGALVFRVFRDVRGAAVRDDETGERMGASEMGWAISPSGIARFTAGMSDFAAATERRRVVLDALAGMLHCPRSQVEAIVVQRIAPTRWRRPPEDLAAVSLFEVRTAGLAWLGPESTASHAALVYLRGCAAEDVADRCARALAPLDASDASWQFPTAHRACPHCAAPSSLPASDAHLHPAWCTLDQPWQCERCRVSLPKGAVVARGRSDGEVMGWSGGNVLLNVGYIAAQVVAAVAGGACAVVVLVAALEFEPIAIAISVGLLVVSVAALVWARLRGPNWRLPLMRRKPARGRRTCDLVLCATRGGLEIGRLRGSQWSRWRRVGWSSSEGLYTELHPEGTLLVSRAPNSFRRWGFLPSDPRGYRSAELAEALQRAFGAGEPRTP
jgi:hypothetical protein